MTRKIYPGHANYIPEGSTGKVLHSGPGKVRLIVATAASATPAGLALYDDSDLLINLQVASPQPVVIVYPLETPLVFSTNLKANTGATVRAHVITEA